MVKLKKPRVLESACVENRATRNQTVQPISNRNKENQTFLTL